MCNLTWVTHTGEPRGNYHPAPQFTLALTALISTCKLLTTWPAPNGEQTGLAANFWLVVDHQFLRCGGDLSRSSKRMNIERWLQMNANVVCWIIELLAHFSPSTTDKECNLIIHVHNIELLLLLALLALALFTNFYKTMCTTRFNRLTFPFLELSLWEMHKINYCKNVCEAG